jgi:flagellar biosynthesis/type III secretory pathway M-ring protein FliF/YscJ
MEKKNVLSLGLLFLALLVIGGGVYYLYAQRENETASNQDQPELEELPPLEEEEESFPYDDFLLTHEYVGDNTWNYEVTGTLPNPCFKITFEPVITEGDPEQVAVEGKIQEPSADEVCAQVIQEVKESGTFNASEDAVIILDIELIPADTVPVE